MKRLLLVLVSLAFCTSVQADEIRPSRIGIGFHGTRAPLGVRYWYAPDAAFDLNLGFVSQVGYSGLRLNDYVAQAGFPFVLHRWDRVAAELRPGFEYALEDQERVTPDGAFVVTDHVLQAAIELEAEVFVVKQLSVSGGVGVAMAHRDFGGSDVALTSWAFTGRNFTDIGFHLYFGGPR
jgi:hypothetical protein